MTLDLTLRQVKRLHLEVDDQLQFFRSPSYWLGTREEFEAAHGDWEAIAAQCEAIIRAAGEWEDHWKKVLSFRAARG
jgi:hypothetical protein